MSAPNVINKRAPALLAAAVLALHLAVVPALAEQAAAQGDAPAEQLNREAEEEVARTGPAGAEQAATAGISDLEVVSIIRTDEQGRELLIPYNVFCDRSTDETYVVDNGRVTVYGDNFFPVATIGAGRGLSHATGVYVDGEGNVYVPQSSYYDRPIRITVYNAAFFPIRHIDLSVIPGVESAPRSLVIGDNGFMYVAFDPGLRGLLVLDQEGRFSHWLKPMDLILDQQAIAEARESQETEATQEAREPLEAQEPLEVQDAQDVQEPLETKVQGEEGEAFRKEKPPFDASELLPEPLPQGSKQVLAKEGESGMGPVQVNDIQRDSNGNLYLLSSETSKVYIYNNEEEYLYNFGEKGGSTGKLSQPQKLVVDDRKKAIYIVDYMRHSILIYDLGGRFMHEFGGKGNRPGWFQYPRSIDTNSRGELLVADMFNRRVQVLDVRFEYKFPLFQVPFVYQPPAELQPQPLQAAGDRYYGPGFSAGEQAATSADKEKIRALLERDDDVI